jgi:hypothetical protein
MVPPSRPAQMTPEQQDQMRTTPRPPSNPPSNLMVPPSRSSSDPGDSLMRTIPRGSTSPSNKLSADEQDQLRTLPRRAPSSGSSATGLAANAGPHQSTTLGVPPPPKPNAPLRLAGPDRAPKKASNLWLIIGALLFIAAGIVLAFVLVG